MDLLPSDLGGDGARIMGRSQPGCLRGVCRGAARMGSHVGHARRLTCCPGSGYCGRVADLPSCRMSAG